MFSCQQCNSGFEITDADRMFLKNISPVFGGRHFEIPDPVFCPSCRLQNRMAFREERQLYHRRCDATGKDIISVYSPDKPYKVYATDHWYSDHFDPLAYGRDFDFSRPFFDQFAELSLAVPKLQYSVYDNENCPYVNRLAHCRNCHLCTNIAVAEDSHYCEAGYNVQSSSDCSFSKNIQWCASCLDSQECYGSTHLLRCTGISDSAFCFDCHGSSNLILCWNLANRSYCIMNRQYSKEEFFKKKEEMQLGCYSFFRKYETMLRDIVYHRAVHRYATVIRSENCSGDAIFSSKNCRDCYNILHGEDLTRVFSVDNNAKTSMDTCFMWDAELVYESMSVSGYGVALSFNIWESSNVYYSELCKGSHYLFGCVGVKNRKYCVLNKEYTREAYEVLVPRIIGHMRSASGGGEWGRFFPTGVSNFGYNESVAQDFFPLEKSAAAAAGFKWSDFEAPATSVPRQIAAADIPDDIRDAPDDITEAGIACEKTGKIFRIIPQELQFYRKMNWPLPRRSPDVRRRDRWAYRNDIRLHDRQCHSCRTSLRSPHSPESPEKVCCEPCYQKTVYA